jgi:hypothetical protein
MPQGVLHGESPRQRNEAVERDVFGPRHWAQVIEAEMMDSGRGRNRVVPWRDCTDPEESVGCPPAALSGDIVVNPGLKSDRDRRRCLNALQGKVAGAD